MATKQQLEEGIRRAHAAGDAKAVQTLGTQLKSLQNPPPKPKAEPSFWDKAKQLGSDVYSTVGEAALGIPEGLNDAAAFVTDPIAEKIIALVGGDEKKAAALMKKIRAQELADRERKRKDLGISSQPIARDIGKGTGGLLLPIPGKAKLEAAGKIGRAAVRGVQGALSGAAIDPTKESAGTGAAANIVLPPIISAAAKPIIGLASKGANYVRGLMTPPVVSTAADLGPEAAARVANYQAVGVNNPTTAMVTRNPVAQQFEQNAKNTSAGVTLAEQIGDVEKALINEGDRIVAKISPTKPNAEATGTAAQKALEAKSDELQDVIKTAYDTALATRGQELVGRLDILRGKMIDPFFKNNVSLNKMRKSVVNYLKDIGVVANAGGVSQPATVAQVEGLRRFIGELGDNSPASRKARRDLITALDDDVIDIIGDDALKGARDLAKARFAEFEQSLVGKIADAKMPAEDLTRHILKGSNEEVRAVVQSFTTGTPTQIARGAAAHTQLKAQIVDDLLTTAVDRDGSRMAGRTLLKNFTENSEKLKIVLSPAEYKELEQLVIASADATMPSTALMSQADTPVAKLFENLPPKVLSRWNKLTNTLKTSAAHSLAFITGGAPANVALGVAQQSVGTAAERKAAEIFIKKIELAKDPAAAAAAIAQAKTAAKSNPIVKDFLYKKGLVGTAATAAVNPSGEQ